MDHKYIHDFDLVERYLVGKLTTEETAEFEAHFVDCRECVAQLESTRALIDGLRVVASEQKSDDRAYGPTVRFWPRPMRSPWSLVFASGVLLLFAFMGAVVFNQIRRSRVEADQAKTAATEWERRYEEERASSSSAEKRNNDSEQDLKGQLSKLREELDKERKENTRSIARGEASLKPQINVAIFQLKSIRGREPTGGPLNELNVPRAPANFLILAPLEGEVGHKAYRATIKNDRKQVIWKASGLRPDPSDSISVGFNSVFFRDGNYVLTVEGVSTDGSRKLIGEYSFRVRKTPAR